MFGSRLIFGSHFPFRVAQLRDARARAGKLSPIMILLTRRKIAIATQLGSRALRADAAESITCGWLSLVVVVGLLADYVLGAWWVDAVTSLAIVWFVIKEGREAWSGEDCCDHD
jgi:divalent metal cation (Fe/Co/Zn/Cd) transporter